MNAPANPLAMRMEGPSPAVEVAKDLARRGALIAPVAAMVGAIFWGTDGAAAEKGRQCQRRERLMTFEFEKHSKLMAESGMHASLVRLRPQNKNI